ncbi:MAG TPA: hypothetical protein VJ302_37285 [Blastocatellia bacterium]|nr:hypothetical protein [Blastocatellia bacterium]
MPRSATSEGRVFRQPLDRCGDQVKDYLDAVSASFCPYINPSGLHNLLLFSEYRVDARDEESLCRNLFYVGLIHTEILRASRLQIDEKRGNLLACENLIFDGEALNQIEGEDIFRWPHWFLKVLYTGRGVLFGKFWKGERVKSRDGRDVPVPPVHLLSIRSAVKPIDSRFFGITPELLEIHASSFDAGARAFDFPMSSGSQEMLDLIGTLARSEIWQSSVIDLCSRCERTSLFEDCLKEVISREISLSGQSFTQNRFRHLLGDSDER